MDESVAFLQPITTAILGIGGICAAIAIISAIIRYFLYQHDDEIRRPLKARFVHVFGFIGAFGVILGGVPKFVTAIMQNSASQQIQNEAGSSFVPNSFSQNGSNYSNLGEALGGTEQKADEKIAEDYANNVANNTQNAYSTDENGNTTVDIAKILANAFIASASNGVGAIP